MHRMTLAEPRAVQGSCGHDKDFVQCISCYEIERRHSSSLSEKNLEEMSSGTLRYPFLFSLPFDI